MQHLIANSTKIQVNRNQRLGPEKSKPKARVAQIEVGSAVALVGFLTSPRFGYPQ